jgi:hypothetical protein
MSEEHRGFVYSVKGPTRDANKYVACVVVTPYRRNGKANVGAKVQRNIGRAKAVQMAVKLLRRCDAPSALLARVEALASTSSKQ